MRKKSRWDLGEILHWDARGNRQARREGGKQGKGEGSGGHEGRGFRRGKWFIAAECAQESRSTSTEERQSDAIPSKLWFELEGCGSHKIAGIKERVGGEEIEAVGTDHSF